MGVVVGRHRRFLLGCNVETHLLGVSLALEIWRDRKSFRLTYDIDFYVCTVLALKVSKSVKPPSRTRGAFGKINSSGAVN